MDNSRTPLNHLVEILEFKAENGENNGYKS